MSKGGSHDPQVVADGCDSCSRAYSPDRHWNCPGARFWWWVRGRLSRRLRARLLRWVRARLLRRLRWFLSGLLRVCLFPVLLLLLLIAYSLRPETVQPGLAWTPDAALELAGTETE